MELVGHATSAIAARRRSASPFGCNFTIDCPTESSRTNVDGVTMRHTSQSMHELSTKTSPSALFGSRSARRAMSVSMIAHRVQLRLGFSRRRKRIAAAPMAEIAALHHRMLRERLGRAARLDDAVDEQERFVGDGERFDDVVIGEHDGDVLLV